MGSHPAPPVAQGTRNSRLHVQEQDLSVPWCVWGSPSTATPTPECLHGAPLEHSMVTSWETPPRRAGGHLCPGVAPRGTVHPEGNVWICVKFQRKTTFPSNPGSLHFPCGVPALHHSLFSLLLLKMYSRKNTQHSPDLEVWHTSNARGWAQVWFLLLLLLSAFPPAPFGACPWDGGGGMDPGRQWRSWLVKSTLHHVGENKNSPTGRCLPRRFRCRS